MAAMSLAKLFREAGDRERENRFLKLAALTDTRLAVKENEALLTLSTNLIVHCDIALPYYYITSALSDANFYNSRVKISVCARVQPIIESNYLDRIETQRRHLRRSPLLLSVFDALLAGALSEYKGTVVVGHHDTRSFGGYGYYGRTGARSVTTVLCGATRCAPSGLCRGALPYGAPRPRAAAVRSLTGVSAGRRASRGCVPGCPASCGCPSSGR